MLYELAAATEWNGEKKYAVLCKNRKAFLVGSVVGIFEGQFVKVSFSSVKGFARSIFAYPVPVLDVQSYETVRGTVKEVSKTVLVVDDSTITRLVVRKTLEAAGYKVIEAQNGEDALEKEGFHLAIVDVEMPGMDGYELTKKLKEREPKIPVIILSARSGSEEIRKGLEAGANAYVVKGEPPKKILDLVDRFLRSEAQ